MAGTRILNHFRDHRRIRLQTLRGWQRRIQNGLATNYLVLEIFEKKDSEISSLYLDERLGNSRKRLSLGMNVSSLIS